jgi:hypothetical protein
VFITEHVVQAPDVPHFAKLFDLHMMCCGTGRERTDAEYAELLCRARWRKELDVLVHPLSDDEYDDHTANALWLGTPQDFLRHRWCSYCGFPRGEISLWGRLEGWNVPSPDADGVQQLEFADSDWRLTGQPGCSYRPGTFQKKLPGKRSDGRRKRTPTCAC